MPQCGIVTAAALVMTAGLGGCGGGSGEPTTTGLAIVTPSGAPLHAAAGDAFALKVVVVESDGSTRDLPAGATVTWTAPATVTTLPPDSTNANPLPVPAPQPTAVWIANPNRLEHASDLANVLFILDPGALPNGALTVTATVAGGSPSGSVSATVDVDPTPAGDATRGAAVYGASGANCAECHGDTGHGSQGAPDATSYTIDGNTYDFPAPGLNAEQGNVGADPAWTAALLAVAARADTDNEGVTLRFPMPDWLTTKNVATGQPLTTQDFADIYAFLQTQTQ
jgi:mono/diheme cytochrome c family protein